MRLTDEDKTLLRSWGEKEDAIPQIQAATCAKYTDIFYRKESNAPKVQISHTKAIELLGREDYLSGIQRSAYHGTACRYVGSDILNGIVFFSSWRLFKEVR